MAKWVIESDTLVDIADAIREKKGTVAPIAVDELADEVASISGGGGIPRHQVPQAGTWQFKTTPKTGFLIVGHDDDTADSAQFVRMVTGYGFPVTLNTESYNQSNTIGGDADGQYTTYPVGSVSRFPEGTTVNALNKMVLAQNLGEIAQHDTASGQTWSSSKLTGSVLDSYYATYTAGGGLKSKADFKDAVIEKYASTDIDQGASHVASQRAILEAALGDTIYTIGTWGGKPTFIIDEINIGDTTPLLIGTQGISRAQNYQGDGLLNDTHSHDPYYISRNSGGLEPSGITSVLTNAYNDKRCIEAFQHYYLDGTKAKWDDFKTTMDTIKSWVDQGKIKVVTRKQYFELGEFATNPITSLSLIPDQAQYNVGDTITAANFTCKANLQDTTQAICGDDKILDYSDVDTSTAGTYTAYLEYRGFKTSVSVSVVASGFNLPAYVQEQTDGYYQYVRFSDDLDICYLIYVSEASGGFNGGTQPFTSAGAYAWSFVNGNKPGKIFYSADGSANWSELYSGNIPSTSKSNNATLFDSYTFGTSQAITPSTIVHIGA